MRGVESTERTVAMESASPIVSIVVGSGAPVDLASCNTECVRRGGEGVRGC